MTDAAAFTLEAIDRFAPAIEVPPPAVLDQARRNIEAQVALLQEFGAIPTSELAALAGSRAKRPGVTVDNWRRAHRIVTVRFRDETYVPGFLLGVDARPDPLAQPALATLAAYGASDWQSALWWAIPSSALGGRRPVDVLLAARAEAGHGDPVDVDETRSALAAAADRRRDWF